MKQAKESEMDTAEFEAKRAQLPDEYRAHLDAVVEAGEAVNGTADELTELFSTPPGASGDLTGDLVNCLLTQAKHIDNLSHLVNVLRDVFAFVDHQSGPAFPTEDVHGNPTGGVVSTPETSFEDLAS